MAEAERSYQEKMKRIEAEQEELDTQAKHLETEIQMQREEYRTALSAAVCYMIGYWIRRMDATPPLLFDG